MQIKELLHSVLGHVLPTKKNDYIPHILKDGAILGILGVGLFISLFLEAKKATNNFGLLAEVYPAVIVTLTNENRKDSNLSPLVMSETLNRAAELKAMDMAKHGYFAHNSPSGITPWHWFGQVNYKFIYAGENLAVNFDESEDVQIAWLNSPTHKANIMNKNFTEIGVATAKGFYNGRETTFVVQMFGMPAVTKVSAATNTSSNTNNQPNIVNQKPAPIVAGESAEVDENDLKLIEEKTSVIETTETKFVAVENTNTAVEPKVNNTLEVQKIPWYKKMLLYGDSISGLILSIIVIILFLATAAMVARQYEKHHIKHMISGSVMMIVILSFLFINQLGFFEQKNGVALKVEDVQVVK